MGGVGVCVGGIVKHVSMLLYELLNEYLYHLQNLCIQPNPQWREQFDFNYYEDSQEPLQVEVFCKRGRKCEESWGM